MKTVKQVIVEEKEQYFNVSEVKPLESLVSLGLLEESKFNLVKRAMFSNTSEMTMAEKKSLVSLVESLTSYVLYENQGKDYLAATDKKRPAGYPSEAKIPPVLILKRKAIRVYPDNQKIALYYSQSLDKYISIPFGPKSDELGIHMNEENKEIEMKKISMTQDKELHSLRESSPRETFRNKLKDVREEKLDEFLGPAISAAANILSKVGPGLARAGARAGSYSKLAIKKGVRKGKNYLSQGLTNLKTNSDSPGGLDLDGVVRPVSGGHEFSAAGRAGPPVGNPLPQNRMSAGVPTATDLVAQKKLWSEESTNVDKIKHMVESESKNTTVHFGDSSILINNRTGKKILDIHESLNKTNKKKFEKMLNEDIISFKKAINFVVKVR